MDTTAPTTARAITLGEMRVGISFNPGGSEKVNRIKAAAANFIDLLEDERSAANTHPSLGGEINRLISIAQTDIETAAMYAVKAVTKQ